MFHPRAAEKEPGATTSQTSLFTTHSLRESLTSLYSPPQKKIKITAKKENFCPRPVHLQCHLREYRGVIQRKWCPWWRRTDVIKAVSCCRARKPTPTTWNYLNHASASRNREQTSIASKDPHVRIHMSQQTERTNTTQVQADNFVSTAARTPRLVYSFVYSGKHFARLTPKRAAQQIQKKKNIKNKIKDHQPILGFRQEVKTAISSMLTV